MTSNKVQVAEAYKDKIEEFFEYAYDIGGGSVNKKM